MSPEDQSAFEQLTQAEKLIKALETLVKECDGQGLDPFVVRLKTCIEQCQIDYVSLQRQLYLKSDADHGKPPKTKH